MKKIWVGIALFLFVIISTFLFVVFYFCLSNFMHEKAHVDAAAKQGINLSIVKLKCITFTREHVGASGPVSKQDCEKYNILPIENKKLITHAGFWREFYLSIFFIISLGILGVIYRKKLFDIRNPYLWVLVILVASAIGAILISYICNVYGNPVHYYSPGNICRFCSSPYTDWNTTILNCSLYG